MRPLGEISLAILDAVDTLQAQGRPATMRAIAHLARVGMRDTTRTLAYLKRAGHLVPEDVTYAVAHCTRRVRAYARLPAGGTTKVDDTYSLASIMGCWPAAAS